MILPHLLRKQCLGFSKYWLPGSGSGSCRHLHNNDKISGILNRHQYGLPQNEPYCSEADSYASRITAIFCPLSSNSGFAPPPRIGIQELTIRPYNISLAFELYLVILSFSLCIRTTGRARNSLTLTPMSVQKGHHTCLPPIYFCSISPTEHYHPAPGLGSCWLYCQFCGAGA